MKLNIKKLQISMANKCMSSRELAKAAGLSFSTVYQYLSGKREPSPKNIGRLAKALEVDSETLID